MDLLKELLDGSQVKIKPYGQNWARPIGGLDVHNKLLG
jgi:hypothetical protein